MTAPWLGIDLGTTNSLVAAVRDGVAQVLPVSQDERWLRSAVGVNPEGQVVVGERALELPGRHVYSFKRLMGRGLADVAELELPFDLQGSDASQVRVTLGGRRFTPVELSSLVLRRLKAVASLALGEVKEAVITVPAYFNDAQRQATAMAGRLAGLEVVRLVSEPTAACLAYGLDHQASGIVAVYDLGGGTFDVSLLKLKDGIFEVLSTAGDTQLGGDDLDRALGMQLVLELVAARGDVFTPELAAHLLRRAEALKVELSRSMTAKLELGPPYLATPWTATVTRASFEAAIAPLLERTAGLCRQALMDAGLTPADVTAAVLVGGSTRVPAVKRLVAEVFGQAPHDDLDPEAVVAQGAAIQAAVLQGVRDDVLLLDVVPLSLGIETAGGGVGRLIPRNATVPTAARELFTTLVDHQTAVVIHVVQGEREQVLGCRSLARFLLPVAPGPAGEARIEVGFQVDASGLLKVSARNLATGAAQEVEVQPSFGLAPAEIAQLLEEAERHAVEDQFMRQLLAARHDATVVLQATTKALLGPLATQLSPPERAAIELAMVQLQEALEEPDLEVLSLARTHLEDAARPLAERMMAEALRAAQAKG